MMRRQFLKSNLGRVSTIFAALSLRVVTKDVGSLGISNSRQTADQVTPFSSIFVPNIMDRAQEDILFSFTTFLRGILHIASIAWTAAFSGLRDSKIPPQNRT
ncbi:hypothetical protein M0R45_028287 [Rubus argutus]|uniref:Uncharacterized protein n=1 Tax=Rubus argutus TaxID=59490 RepID=A0AAW1W793_RUBAR